MNPRRLHSDTIFSINSFDFGSAIRRHSVLEGRFDVKELAEVRRKAKEIVIDDSEVEPPAGGESGISIRKNPVHSANSVKNQVR